MSEAAEYFAARFTFDPQRAGVWRELTRFIARDIADSSTVLELGCGYGDFINAVAANRKIAVDVHAAVREHLAPGVEFICGDCAKLGFIERGAVTTVFASNLLEHIAREQLPALLAEIRRVLRPGGRLLLLQPNYRLCPARYFDDYTHVTVFSDVGLCGFLKSEGFSIRKCVPGLLPFSMQSRLPKHPLLVRLYLNSPIRPGAGQMYVVAEKA